MDTLSPTELDEWRARFDADRTDAGAAIEATLTDSLETTDHLTADQLGEAIEWKLGSQGGRAELNRRRLSRVVDNASGIDRVVRNVTRAAFTPAPSHELEDGAFSEADRGMIKHQLDLLSALPGVGAATATVVLTFNDPTNYAVGDRYLFGALLGEERPVTAGNYPDLLAELRTRTPAGLPLREAEKAYYKWYAERR